MRQFLLLSSFLWCAIGAHAQLYKKQFSIPAWKQNDTGWVANDIRFENELGLEHLTQSQETVHFRLNVETYGSEYIDVWTNDFIAFHGLILYTVYGYLEQDKMTHGEHTFRTVYCTDSLTPNQAKEVYDILQPLTEIPDDDSISRWQHWRDASSDQFEVATSQTYSYKSWCNPILQDSTLKEANIIIQSLKRLNILLDLTANWEGFQHGQRWEGYDYGISRTIITYTYIKTSILKRIWWILKRDFQR